MRLALVMLLWASVAAAQTPIRSWNVTSGGKPYGCTTWGDGQEGTWFTLSRLAAGSPSGTDALRVEMIPTNDLGDQGWGCGFPGESGSIAQSASNVRYVRFRIYFEGPMNWRSDNAGGSYSSNNRTGPDKLFIMANLCNSVSDYTRIILHLYADPPDRDTPFLRLTQGTGGAAPADYYEAVTNTWLHVQGKIVPSSTSVAEDGATYLYVNNDNEGAPDASEVGQLITTTGWGVGDCPGSQTVFGDGSQNPLSDDVATSANYRLADFEVDDEFDPNWSDAEAPPTSGPVRLRIRGGDMASAMSLLLLPILWRRR